MPSEAGRKGFVNFIGERSCSFEVQLLNDAATREKLTVMSPMEVVFDDARNHIPDHYYRLVNMPAGGRLRITVERLDDSPLQDVLQD